LRPESEDGTVLQRLITMRTDGVPRTRVLLVDDHAILRAGVSSLLACEPWIEVVGEAGSGEEALRLLEEHPADVVVMDLEMPGMGGLEATRRMAALDPAPGILILTQHGEDRCAISVLEAGASGYLNKRRAPTALIDAIRTVASGEVFLEARGTRLLLRQYRDGGTPDPLGTLSERERDVLMLTARGFSSGEIGRQLFISPKTVDTYRGRLMDKVGLGHRSELVQFALQSGLLRAE